MTYPVTPSGSPKIAGATLDPGHEERTVREVEREAHEPEPPEAETALAMMFVPIPLRGPLGDATADRWPQGTLVLRNRNCDTETSARPSWTTFPAGPRSDSHICSMEFVPKGPVNVGHAGCVRSASDFPHTLRNELPTGAPGSDEEAARLPVSLAVPNLAVWPFFECHAHRWIGIFRPRKRVASTVRLSRRRRWEEV